MRSLLLLGSTGVHAGSFPTGTLTQSNEWEQYPSPFWTAWSDDYGCPAKISPMSDNDDAVEAYSRFCRIFNTTPFTKVLEAINWKICTLPNIESIEANAPFQYTDTAQAINQFYNINGNFDKLESVNNIQVYTQFFNSLPQSGKDWTTSKPPAGDGDELLFWDDADFPDLYTNDERQFIYDTLGAIHSNRQACDVRLTITAEYCYDGMFNANDEYDVYGSFCDEFTLDDIKNKCTAAGCESTMTSDPVTKGDGKDYIVEALVLLIEDKIQEEDAKWTTYIPSPYKKVLFKKGTCNPKCPQPTEWSPWSCWCPNDGVPNDLNLPECKCKEQSRKRIQACTTVDVDGDSSISCEVYSADTPTDVDNYDTCAKYGNAAILGQTNGVSVLANGRPVYTMNTGTDYQNQMTYMSQYTDDVFKNALVGTTAANVCTDTNFHPILSESNWNSGDFSFAVEEATCQIAAVEMVSTDSACSATCGCGTKTRTHTCIFSDGANQGQLVPKDSVEYECCEEKADEQIACSLNCCPEWHTCDYDSSTCASDANFSPGAVYDYATCLQACGPETHLASLRCGCQNQCNYDSSVIIETTVPTGFTRHQSATCDAITTPTLATGAAAVDSAENVADQAVVVAEVGDANYDAIVYRRTATKDCQNQCCVSPATQPVTCPALNCYDTNKDKPWFLTAVKSGELADGSDLFKCTPGSPIYKSSQVCKCDASSNSATCTVNGVSYNLDDNIPDSNVLDTCDYLRKDHINYNGALASIKGKGDNDAYFCCTEEIEQDLFTPWAEWGECKSSPAKNTCGCANDPEDRCGTQIRKRRAKCDGDYKVDDTTCPCVESRKCDLPMCPTTSAGGSPQICEFNPAKLGTSVSYSVSQCEVQSADFTVNPFATTSQLTGANDAACDFCLCSQAVVSSGSAVACGRFQYTCDDKGVDHLIWQDWSECKLAEGTCGVGVRSRIRECDGFTNMDDVENHCYNPTVLRTMPIGQSVAMADHPDYYESEDCYVACPDDFTQYSPWTECSVKFGQGVQMRTVLGDSNKMETRACQGEVAQPKTGRSDPVYTECDATCGDGTRKKMTMNYDTLAFEVVDEPCKIQDCPAPAELVCPAIGKDLDDVTGGNNSDTSNDTANTDNPTAPDTVDNTAQTVDNTSNPGGDSNSSPDNEVPVAPSNNDTVIATQPTNSGDAGAPVEATPATNVTNTDTSGNTSTDDSSDAEPPVGDNTDSNEPESNDTKGDAPDNTGNSTNTDNGTPANNQVETTAPPIKVTTAPVATSTMASAKYIGFSLITLLTIFF